MAPYQLEHFKNGKWNFVAYSNDWESLWNALIDKTNRRIINNKTGEVVKERRLNL